MNAKEIVAKYSPLLPTGKQTVAGNSTTATTQLEPRAALLAWAEADGKAVVAAYDALVAAKAKENHMAQALAVVALRATSHAAWSACGQAVGLGNPTKAKSGAPRARALVAMALGKAGDKGAPGASIAQAAMPTVQRVGKGSPNAQGAAQAQASGKGKGSKAKPKAAAA